MVKKKIKKEDALIEIKKNLKSKKLIIGTKRTIKNMKLGKIKKIFLSSNCPENIKKDIQYYNKISKIDVVELNEKNDEIGVIAKKKTSISVLSLAK